jgi:hypothetical protein
MAAFACLPAANSSTRLYLLASKKKVDEWLLVAGCLIQ